MDRRRFLLVSAATATLPSLKLFAQATTQTAALKLHTGEPGAHVPANFIGLSYETQQLTDPSFFSAENTGLVEQFRQLAPHGVLRIGGNTSDVGWWKPTPESKQPPLPPKVVILPPRHNARPFQELAYSVTPEAVTNLRAFLDATGWTCLYGINLGTSTPERAAEEAVFVAKTLGPKLEYFQIGNEPDDFASRFRVHANWNANAYFDEWIASANAIRARVPHAHFGLPDTGGSPGWSTIIVNRLLALKERPDIAALSHHYYFTGPPSNSHATFDRLLKPDPGIRAAAETVSAAAAKLNTRHRMTEGNTCYLGGKPGFSDVFGASLWAADYLLTLASLGYAGVNLHGGSGKAVADSLGGTLPGELLMPDPKVPHPRPFYTPIAEIDGHYIAEPVSYGMRFAGYFAGATMLPLDFDSGSVNATAYAARHPKGGGLLAIINKDATQDLTVTLPNPDGGSQFHVIRRLTADSLTSHDVKLVEAHGKGPVVTVPHASAVILQRV